MIMKTNIFFVRHAQPDFVWKDDRTRPLTKEGIEDTKKILDFLKKKDIDIFYCSPYKRSIDTIRSSANYYDKEIILDERLRERTSGENGNEKKLFKKRWENFEFAEPGGESLQETQKRAMEVVGEILYKNSGKKIVIGTHGTLLSCILHYYDHDYNFESYWRIIDWMPYIIELEFEGTILRRKKEHFFIKKIYSK